MSLGRDGVGAGGRVGDGGLGQQLDRQVVVDGPLADDAAVAVRGVLAHADVGDHDEVGVGLLQRAHRHLDHALVVVGAGAELVLGGGDAEEDHRADADRDQLGRLGDGLGDRQPLDAGHRLDGLAHRLAGGHEHRLDQVLGAQARLADEVAERLGPAQAAQACGRKAHRLDSTGDARPLGGRLRLTRTSAQAPTTAGEARNQRGQPKYRGQQPRCARLTGRSPTSERPAERASSAGRNGKAPVTTRITS